MTPSERATAAFLAHYGHAPELLVRAPGRVNLIGEHTDYNDGFVLPCAIEHETVVAAARTPGATIDSVAADAGGASDRFDPAAPIEKRGGWRDYVRGIAVELSRVAPLSGARLAIAGNVPPGAGLSSSAALEIAVGRALLEISGRALAPSLLAKAAQRAENDFVGASCGIMDQLISACGIAGHALLIDCRSLEAQPVALPSGAAVVIVNSGIRHTHVGGDYNIRRAQCQAAARHFGVAALRDLDLGTLEAGAGGLDPLVCRRARHVVTENARTLAAAAALAAGDLRRIGTLMAASHVSMRDDFEITVPAIDQLVAIADFVLSGDGGARMTGGGFGGCIVALVPLDRVAALRNAIARSYRTPGGAAADFYVTTAAGGASVAALQS